MTRKCMKEKDRLYLDAGRVDENCWPVDAIGARKKDEKRHLPAKWRCSSCPRQPPSTTLPRVLPARRVPTYKCEIACGASQTPLQEQTNTPVIFERRSRCTRYLESLEGRRRELPVGRSQLHRRIALGRGGRRQHRPSKRGAGRSQRFPPDPGSSQNLVQGRSH